jgi:hypothetical protein
MGKGNTKIIEQFSCHIIVRRIVVSTYTKIYSFYVFLVVYRKLGTFIVEGFYLIFYKNYLNCYQKYQ